MPGSWCWLSFSSEIWKVCTVGFSWHLWYLEQKRTHEVDKATMTFNDSGRWWNFSKVFKAKNKINELCPVYSLFIFIIRSGLDRVGRRQYGNESRWGLKAQWKVDRIFSVHFVLVLMVLVEVHWIHVHRVHAHRLVYIPFAANLADEVQSIQVLPKLHFVVVFHGIVNWVEHQIFLAGWVTSAGRCCFVVRICIITHHKQLNEAVQDNKLNHLEKHNAKRLSRSVSLVAQSRLENLLVASGAGTKIFIGPASPSNSRIKLKLALHS